MIISLRCPNCETEISVPSNDVQEAVSCHECDREISLKISETIRQENKVDACPGCGNVDFYVQRDFNQRVGIGIMLFFALLGLVFVGLDRPFYFYYSLAAGALIDLLLYWLLPEVTVCYACQTIFRKAEKNSAHEPFDLHISDMYQNLSEQ